MENQLSDQERVELVETLDVKLLEGKSLGFALRNSQAYSKRATVAQIPKSSSAGAVLSVCGLKDFLIDEYREFQTDGGVSVVIRCAHVAVLEMQDAPIHVHAQTHEQYIVLSGNGKMILGAGWLERVIDVGPGTIINLPPHEPHGIVSNDDTPIKALLIFTPGLASKEEPKYRDERILHDRTSTRLKELGE